MTDSDDEEASGRWRDAWADLDLLAPDDVCTLLKVKKSWLYDTVECGSLETMRLGKQVRFRPSALMAVLAEFAGRSSPLSRGGGELPGRTRPEIVGWHRARFDELIAEVEGLVVPDERLSCDNQIALSQLLG
jgi:excisionase family DNA binding protein